MERKLAALPVEAAEAAMVQAVAAKKAAFPDLSNEALTAAYPGRCQSLTQVLSTADARLSGLTEKTR